MAFMAAYTPEILDDEIKRHQAEFVKAQNTLTPGELWDMLPVVFPILNCVPGLVGISRFPVDEWIKSGQPILSTKGWCLFAMKIAKQDMQNLGSIFAIAEKLAARL